MHFAADEPYFAAKRRVACNYFAVGGPCVWRDLLSPVVVPAERQREPEPRAAGLWRW